MTLRFVGIPEAVAREVRETMHAPDYGHPAHKIVAQGYGLAGGRSTRARAGLHPRRIVRRDIAARASA